MSIAVIITDRNTDALCTELIAQLPGVNVQQWPDISAPEAVRLAVLWHHPSGIINTMPNLELAVSMGAGIDHMTEDDQITPNIARQRIVTPVLQQNMAQYVLQHILNDHRHHKIYQQQQQQQHWQVLESDEKMPVVGFLGLGELGRFVADRCADLGFQTMAWTKQQDHPRHRCFHGQAGLKEVCQNSRYLVVLLPLNTATTGIINANTLSWCDSDTVLINVGRGAHVNEKDLLFSLGNNTLKHAVLDVFNQEPLAPNHAFWSHPRVTLTPHSSSRSDVKQTAAQVVDYYRGLVDG